MLRNLLMLAVLTGCSIRVKSDPVEVNHNLNFSELTAYFTEYCKSIGLDETPEQLEDCVAQEIANFYKLIGKSVTQ